MRSRRPRHVLQPLPRCWNSLTFHNRLDGDRWLPVGGDTFPVSQGQLCHGLGGWQPRPSGVLVTRRWPRPVPQAPAVFLQVLPLFHSPLRFAEQRVGGRPDTDRPSLIAGGSDVLGVTSGGSDVKL